MAIFLLLLLSIISAEVTSSSLKDNTYSFNWPILSKYDHFAKRQINAIRAGGRLIERHISYLQAAGYKSILSVVNFTTTDSEFKGVAGSWPSTSGSYKVIRNLF